MINLSCLVSVLTHKDNHVFLLLSLLFTLLPRHIFVIPLLLHPVLQFHCLIELFPTCRWSCGPSPNSSALTAAVCNKEASPHSPFAPGSRKSCCEDTGSHSVLCQLVRSLFFQFQSHKALQPLASPPW